MRASSANAMVSSDSWTPETRSRKASRPTNAPTALHSTIASQTPAQGPMPKWVNRPAAA